MTEWSLTEEPLRFRRISIEIMFVLVSGIIIIIRLFTVIWNVIVFRFITYCT